MAVVKRDGTVWYYHYNLPVFQHAVGDVASFRMFTSQLCDSGRCKLVDVERVFGVTAISVKRALKQYRAQGTKSFFVSHRPQVVPRVLTPEVLAKVQELLDEGLPPRAAGERLGLKADTVRDAIEHGRLRRPKKTSKIPARP